MLVDASFAALDSTNSSSFASYHDERSLQKRTQSRRMSECRGVLHIHRIGAAMHTSMKMLTTSMNAGRRSIAPTAVWRYMLARCVSSDSPRRLGRKLDVGQITPNNSEHSTQPIMNTSGTAMLPQ